jgi:hypothetical protein
MANEQFDRLGSEIAKTFQGIGSERDRSLESVHNLQGMARALLQNEALRLSQKGSVKVSQLVKVQAKLDRSLAAVQAVAAEKTAFQVKRPTVTEKEMVIDGMVVDESRRGAAGLFVAMLDRNGRAVTGVERVQTDKTGHYLFRISGDLVAKFAEIAKAGITVRVETEKAQVLGSLAKPVVVSEPLTTLPTITVKSARPGRPTGGLTQRPTTDVVLRPEPGGGVIRQPITRPVLRVPPAGGRVAPVVRSAAAAAPPAAQPKSAAEAPPGAKPTARKQAPAGKPAAKAKTKAAGAPASKTKKTTKPGGGTRKK